MANQIVNPGFGYGQCFGVPTTVGLAPTSTLVITTNVTIGKFWLSGLATGVNVAYLSTSVASATTGTWTIANGINTYVFNDGQSLVATNTTTSVSLVFIKAP